jgi:hypothetical protein
MSKLLNEEQLLENQMRLLNEAKRIARRSKPTMVRELKQSVLRFQMKGSDSQNLQQVQADLLGAFPPSTWKLLDGYLQVFLGTKDFGALVFALKKQLTEEAVGALVHQNEEGKLEIVLSTVRNLEQYSQYSLLADTPSEYELRLIFAIAATVRECIPSKWRKLFKQIQGRTGKMERRGSKVITYTLEGVEISFSGGDAKRRSEETASSVIAKAYADSLSARELSPEIECALLGAYSSIFGRERGEETGMLPARSRPSGFFALCSKEGLLAIEGSDLEPDFNIFGHQEACLAMKILANFCQDLYEAASQ